jgi:hypothetical protein
VKALNTKEAQGRAGRLLVQTLSKKVAQQSHAAQGVTGEEQVTPVGCKTFKPCRAWHVLLWV